MIYLLVTFRRCKLSWPKVSGEFKEWSRIFSEVMDIKHSLRIGQIREVDG